jgi:hypothetical protein
MRCDSSKHGQRKGGAAFNESKRTCSSARDGAARYAEKPRISIGSERMMIPVIRVTSAWRKSWTAANCTPCPTGSSRPSKTGATDCLALVRTRDWSRRVMLVLAPSKERRANLAVSYEVPLGLLRNRR